MNRHHHHDDDDESIVVQVVEVREDADEEEIRVLAFKVNIGDVLRPLIERLDRIMEAGQSLGAEVDAVIQAVRDAEGRVQVKIGELEAEIQALTTTGSPEEQAAMAKLEALKVEVAGIVPAATDATPPPVDTPPAEPPPVDAPPVETPPADVPGDPAPPADPAPPVDAPPADVPPSDAPPADVPSDPAPPTDAPPADAPTEGAPGDGPTG